MHQNQSDIIRFFWGHQFVSDVSSKCLIYYNEHAIQQLERSLFLIQTCRKEIEVEREKHPTELVGV